MRMTCIQDTREQTSLKLFIKKRKKSDSVVTLDIVQDKNKSILNNGPFFQQ